MSPAANSPRLWQCVGTVPNWTAMHKPKPYKCSICGVEVPDLPMPVLRHQLSHVRRRPYSGSAPARERAEPKQGSESPGADAQSR